MKWMKNIGAATGLLLISGAATAQSPGEIGYAKGSLGYDALISGDNELALQQLEASEKLHGNDPARLINLGQAYARLGRTGDAARMFMAAMQSNRKLDLVLASGEVINSRDAAELALRNLSNRIAAR